MKYLKRRLWKYTLFEDEKFHIKNLSNVFKRSFSTDYFTYNYDIEAMLILKGYCWDGPSGPTLDTMCSMRASLIHDCLTQIAQRTDVIEYDRQELKKISDKYFYDVLIEDGMGKFRAKCWKLAVNIGAGYDSRIMETRHERR